MPKFEGGCQCGAKPGDCHYYAPGAVHSPKWSDGGTRLLRIEGKNLDHVRRSNIRAA